MLRSWEMAILIGALAFAFALLGMSVPPRAERPAVTPIVRHCAEDDLCFDAFLDGNHVGHYIVGR